MYWKALRPLNPRVERVVVVASTATNDVEREITFSAADIHARSKPVPC
jgi:hypothetical protein